MRIQKNHFGLLFVCSICIGHSSADNESGASFVHFSANNLNLRHAKQVLKDTFGNTYYVTNKTNDKVYLDECIAPVDLLLEDKLWVALDWILDESILFNHGIYTPHNTRSHCGYYRNGEIQYLTFQRTGEFYSHLQGRIVDVELKQPFRHVHIINDFGGIFSRKFLNPLLPAIFQAKLSFIDMLFSETSDFIEDLDEIRKTRLSSSIHPIYYAIQVYNHLHTLYPGNRRLRSRARDLVKEYEAFKTLKMNEDFLIELPNDISLDEETSPGETKRRLTIVNGSEESVPEKNDSSKQSAQQNTNSTEENEERMEGNPQAAGHQMQQTTSEIMEGEGRLVIDLSSPVKNDEMPLGMRIENNKTAATWEESPESKNDKNETSILSRSSTNEKLPRVDSDSFEQKKQNDVSENVMKVFQQTKVFLGNLDKQIYALASSTELSSIKMTLHETLKLIKENVGYMKTSDNALLRTAAEKIEEIINQRVMVSDRDNEKSSSLADLEKSLSSPTKITKVPEKILFDFFSQVLALSNCVRHFRSRVIDFIEIAKNGEKYNNPPIVIPSGGKSLLDTVVPNEDNSMLKLGMMSEDLEDTKTDVIESLRRLSLVIKRNKEVPKINVNNSPNDPLLPTVSLQPADNDAMRLNRPEEESNEEEVSNNDSGKVLEKEEVSESEKDQSVAPLPDKKDEKVLLKKKSLYRKNTVTKLDLSELLKPIEPIKYDSKMDELLAVIPFMKHHSAPLPELRIDPKVDLMPVRLIELMSPPPALKEAKQVKFFHPEDMEDITTGEFDKLGEEVEQMRAKLKAWKPLEFKPLEIIDHKFPTVLDVERTANSEEKKRIFDNWWNEQQSLKNNKLLSKFFSFKSLRGRTSWEYSENLAKLAFPVPSTASEVTPSDAEAYGLKLKGLCKEWNALNISVYPLNQFCNFPEAPENKDLSEEEKKYRSQDGIILAIEWMRSLMTPAKSETEFSLETMASMRFYISSLFSRYFSALDSETDSGTNSKEIYSNIFLFLMKILGTTPSNFSPWNSSLQLLKSIPNYLTFKGTSRNSPLDLLSDTYDFTVSKYQNTSFEGLEAPVEQNIMAMRNIAVEANYSEKPIFDLRYKLLQNTYSDVVRLEKRQSGILQEYQESLNPEGTELSPKEAKLIQQSHFNRRRWLYESLKKSPFETCGSGVLIQKIPYHIFMFHAINEVFTRFLNTQKTFITPCPTCNSPEVLCPACKILSSVLQIIERQECNKSSGPFSCIFKAKPTAKAILYNDEDSMFKKFRIIPYLKKKEELKFSLGLKELVTAFQDYLMKNKKEVEDLEMSCADSSKRTTFMSYRQTVADQLKLCVDNDHMLFDTTEDFLYHVVLPFFAHLYKRPIDVYKKGLKSSSQPEVNLLELRPENLLTGQHTRENLGKKISSLVEFRSFFIDYYFN